jgi:serine/threonine protein phosphatase 1
MLGRAAGGGEQNDVRPPPGRPVLWHGAACAIMAPIMVAKTPKAKKGGPARKPRTPKERRIYAIGDIHGRLDLLRDLHEAIRKDAAKAPNKRKTLVYLGDYVDRGPQSSEVIDVLVREPLEGFRTVHLKGNHEDFLLRFLEDAFIGPDWMMNGGMETLESYDLRFYDRGCAWDGLEGIRRDFLEVLPESHLDFLQGLERYHVEGDYLFVHAGIKPGVAVENQADEDLMWIRHGFLDCEADLGKIVVHGHTIRNTPDERPNRIGIDTGAFYSGRLTCLVLDGTRREFLHT